VNQIDAWPNVVVGYVFVLGVIVAYSVWTIVRGRRLSKQVPPEDRRWM
jgi:hypothetical protein